MDLDIRRAVLHNIKDNNKQELQETIVDAIQKREEKMLPGLGVLLEVIWNKADPAFRDQLLTQLEQGVKAS
ncbi:small acid-soluble spore protein SspI [Sporolactobacillus spathodeae]|uniref:Small, acid-soluble spore protein I n=1 Tax=Sporolactobacillus spathodeae TaxID=1465502 RepID=A0ABS2QCU3_9BACL|nr:small acid-soluble spore protein SspI [Sporolactobacillus spathodeae]MBM7658752.1 small acid-soluble spore protein I (minor) [Sporolactobacillus spathodeae]